MKTDVTGYDGDEKPGDMDPLPGVETELIRLKFRQGAVSGLSPIGEMQGGFANTLVIEPGTDGASKVREAE